MSQYHSVDYAVLPLLAYEIVVGHVYLFERGAEPMTYEMG